MTAKKLQKKNVAEFKNVHVRFYNLEAFARVERAFEASGFPSLSVWMIQAAIEKAERDLQNAD